MYQYPSPEPHEPQAHPTEPQASRKQAGRGRRRGATAFLALALVGTAAGSGAIGTVAADRWLVNDQGNTGGAAQGASLTTQPLQAGAGQSASIASQVYKRAGGAVVEVQTAGESGRGLTPQGGGSGFVVDAKGLILTNRHVVSGAGAVRVRFANGETRDAEVLGTSPASDLALLRVQNLPANVPVAALGNSESVQVGETAVAIGSPFGLEQTVTQGIVSAIERNYGPQRDLIQTDAPINPGNSGGPLLNSRGEVIGVNTLNESPVRGSVGVGFAVPIDSAKTLMPRLEAGETVRRAWMGIAGYDLDTTTAHEQDLRVTEGVLVLEVVAGGPAADAGVRGGQGGNGQMLPEGGDVITAVEGTKITDMSGLGDAVAAKRLGQEVRLTVLRDGQTRQITVKLAAWPDQQQQMVPQPQP
ncbi:MAG: trypsin-like peptidase domain-containing protein [Chloroflexia bacterium]|nr:trypsin-like peptidase domain-containing protein [Chloroflexia bacterium]